MQLFLFLVQANSRQDSNALNALSTNFSITAAGSSDAGGDSIPDNSIPKTANVTTKHVKQNSFDSGIADAAHSFSSSGGSSSANGVLSD